MTTWTKELPKESGEFWWRMDADTEPEVVRFTLLPECCWYRHEIDYPLWPEGGNGLWWPERILPPDELRATWTASAQAPKDIILYASALPPVKVELDPNHPHA
jgi:hypothetical protein